MPATFDDHVALARELAAAAGVRDVTVLLKFGDGKYGEADGLHVTPTYDREADAVAAVASRCAQLVDTSNSVVMGHAANGVRLLIVADRDAIRDGLKLAAGAALAKACGTPAEVLASA